ncbi:hypothetical protein EW026_g5412 [Hermanssonia centrifuga]|uniref:FAS1 domain-containing protein n=1 Tax=Hermanssonia centrifuga TaxID=98765 RepID=A0A4S4KII2_9APHY|nr:hypothetical protein EW026_g5412 [Hermanssonia centrifuga]
MVRAGGQSSLLVHPTILAAFRGGDGSLTMFAYVLAYAAICFMASGHVVLAQNQTFITGLLANLDAQGLTNFTSIVRQVQSDTSEIAYFLSLSDSSSPKTLFVPNNDAFSNPSVNFYGYSYDSSNTEFLAAILLYHLVPGTWNQANLGTGPNHTILTTSLVGHNVSFLENNKAQVFACGSSVAGFEIYNQLTATAVVSTTTFGQLTVHVLNAIMGIPGTFTDEAENYSLNSFISLQQSGSDKTVESSNGITLFVPGNDAFTTAKAQLASLSPQSIYNNHVIAGQTVWYSGFTSATYTSVSGHNYTFTVASDSSYAVTLNGVKANIVRSDFLMNNGVMHIIDTVLSNVTAEAAPSSTSASSTTSQSSTGTSSSTSSQASNTAVGSGPGGSSKSSLSGGAIAGIVIAIVAAVIGFIVAFWFWRRRNSPSGGYFDPPQPYNEPSSAHGYEPAKLADVLTGVTPFTGTPSDSILTVYVSPANASQVQFVGAPAGEKTMYSTSPQNVGNTSPRALAYATSGITETAVQPPSPPAVQPGPQATGNSAMPITDEVVDHLLQRFAQRIDRGHPGDLEAPPVYPN